MEDGITKEDLRQFGMQLIDSIRRIIEGSKMEGKAAVPVEWLKARVVRKLLDISPGSLQNLRITGKVRYKKVLGSYYYNKADLAHLFNETHQQDAPGAVKQ